MSKIGDILTVQLKIHDQKFQPSNMQYLRKYIMYTTNNQGIPQSRNLRKWKAHNVTPFPILNSSARIKEFYVKRLLSKLMSHLLHAYQPLIPARTAFTISLLPAHAACVVSSFFLFFPTCMQSNQYQNNNKPGSYRRRLSLFAPRPNSPHVGHPAEGVDNERACEL
jgi:hypothetical protein